MKKVLISGGHLTPALAVIDILKKRNWKFVYVGRKYALEGDGAISAEAQISEKLGFRFIPLTSGRLQRRISFRSFISFLKIPLGFYQAFKIIQKEQPDVVLSFGGYIALPLVLWAYFFKIPVLTHEQTMVPGFANKLIARFSQKICISWEANASQFPLSKTILTGNPLRKEIFEKKANSTFPKDKPLLFVTGGNLGSHTINSAVEQILPLLLDQFVVVHQCGNAQEFHDYERLEKLRTQLTKPRQARYFLYTYIDHDLIGSVFAQTQVVLSRSGANTLSEIIALCIPAIFIPLPWSGGGEQAVHAAFLEERQAAVVLSQSQLNSSKLLDAIQKVYAHRNQYIVELKKLTVFTHPNAAEKIVEVLESLA